MTFSANQIAAFLTGTILGDGTRQVQDVAPVETAHEGQLSFVCDAKFMPHIATTRASIILMSAQLQTMITSVPDTTTVIVVPNARAAMGELLKLVEQTMRPKKQGIEQPCHVGDKTIIPEDAYVGAFAYIGNNVRLGKGVQIYPNVYIGDNVTIGDNTILYAGARVYYNCVIGNQCIIHAGVVIGSDGFGFEPDDKAVNQKLPQIGNVVIEDDVEIGANTTIDRAMMGSTRIHRNVKIDNLVQIAHNVEIGESTFLCAQVGIAGSSKVGAHCILTGQVGVAGHIEIADGCVFGAQSGIASSVKNAGQYQGSPAIDALRWRRSTVGFKQLPEILQRLQALETK